MPLHCPMNDVTRRRILAPSPFREGDLPAKGRTERNCNSCVISLTKINLEIITQIIFSLLIM